jgi:predicted nucleic acid-binding protein
MNTTQHSICIGFILAVSLASMVALCAASTIQFSASTYTVAEARLLADLRKHGQAMPIKDSLIAATAPVHGLTVATRNRVDFAKAGAKVVDRFL